ncbi:MAG: DUF1559 family PulG-like putative transporter [Aureliella sp.]
MLVAKRFLVAVSLTAAIALIVAAWVHARASSAGSVCAENLRQIGLGLANYESVWKKYPPASLGGHSWRIRCVPMLISSPLYSNYDFDQRWDSDDNMTVDQRPIPYGKGPPEIARTESIVGMPFAYQCESGLGTHSTAFLMVVGPDAFGMPEECRAAREITDNLETVIGRFRRYQPWALQRVPVCES